VNLNGADLRFANLGFALLSDANLRGAKLIEANLGGASLNGASLRGANLRGANLRDAFVINTDLSNTDLRAVDLEAVDLRGANLSGANLRDANLMNTDLRNTDLRDTNLIKANLAGANLNGGELRGANLNGANLQGARLSYSNINHAKLNGANLSGSSFYETTFGNTNLTDAIGLEHVKHRGPSNLDQRTLTQLWPLPIKFLRGCGLSDWQIESTKLLQPSLTIEEINDISYKIIQLKTRQPISYFSCFISYSHADKGFAHRLHDQLQDFGIRCWLDEHQLWQGDDIHERVDQGTKLWDKVLLCVSEHSLTSRWIDNEIEAASKKEQQLMKQRKEKVLALIPLNLDSYIFSNDCEYGKARQVKSRLTADFTGWESDNSKFEQAFERILKLLSTDNADR